MPYEMARFDDVAAAMDILRLQGLTLGLISNMNQRGNELTESLGLDPYLDFAVTSLDVGAEKPHPPIWCPSKGSMENIEWAVHPDRKYVYLHGYTAASGQLGYYLPVYVGKTDDQVREEAKLHFEAMFNVFLPKISLAMFSPPGYVTTESMRRFVGHNKSVRGEITFEDLIEHRIVICGGPETVRHAIEDCHHQAGFEHLLCLLQFAILPADLTEKNI